MNASKQDTTSNANFVSWGWVNSSNAGDASALKPPAKPKFDLLHPIRQQLDQFEVCTPRLAHWLCQLIPSQCPFERDIKFFGRTLLHIPPLCKLNPLYDEVVALRFRALCYLADVCGEDVTPYC